MSDAFTPVFEASRPALEDLAEKFNAKAKRVKAAGSLQDQINEILTSSQDQNVVNYRAVKEELENNLAEILQQIETYVMQHLVQTDVNVEKEKDEAKELKAQWTALANGLKGLPGGTEFLDSLTKLESLGRNSSATGQQRSRFEKIEIRDANADASTYREVFDMVPVKNKEGKLTGENHKTVTYSVLARELSKASGTKVDVANIYTHSNAANTNDGRPFEFALSIPKANGESSANFMVRATPKA